MRLFFDLEFTGLHQKTTPISIGIVSSDGAQFYAEFADYDSAQVNPWLEQNVIEKLWRRSPEIPLPKNVVYYTGDRAVIVGGLRAWLKQWEHIQMWGDVLAYDWVLFCELFGGAQEIPESIYYIPFDLATELRARGLDPDTNRWEFAGILSSDHLRHNALWDAIVTRACYEKLRWQYPPPREEA